jgi:glycosyltransferase involved in cell wall biosynthesis
VDIYHTQYITPFFVSKSIKIVTHIHDVSFKAYPEYIKKIDLFFLNLLIPKSLKRADKIIAVSEFTKNEIIKYYKINPDKIEVICNALGDDFLKNNYPENKLAETRKKYHLPEKFILYLGTLQPRKNIPFLIESFAKIKEKIPEIKLVLAGNREAHNFDEKINETILKLNLQDSIIFSGYVSQSDVPIVYKLASVFVFPSLYEGFGIPILEAMSQKIPVLASNIPVHREIGGEAALYFNIGSVDDFSEKLYNLITDENLRNKLISSGFERINLFSWQKSTEKLLNIYKKLTN